MKGQLLKQKTRSVRQLIQYHLVFKVDNITRKQFIKVEHKL